VIDLSTSDWDMAIRTNANRHVAESDPVYSCELCLVASPRYLAHRPAPKYVTELVDHVVLLREGNKHRNWSKLLEDEAIGVDQFGLVMSLGSTIAIREAAREGLGVALLPAFVVQEYLESGLLLSFLPLLTKKQKVNFYLARLELPQLRSYADLLRQAFSKAAV